MSNSEAIRKLKAFLGAHGDDTLSFRQLCSAAYGCGPNDLAAVQRAILETSAFDLGWEIGRDRMWRRIWAARVAQPVAA